MKVYQIYPTNPPNIDLYKRVFGGTVETAEFVFTPCLPLFPNICLSQQQQYQQQQQHHHQAYWTMRPMLPGQPMLPPHQAQYGAMFAVATAANLNMAVSTAATMAGSPMPLLPVPPRLGGYGHPVTNAPLAASQRDFPTLAAAAAAQRRPAPIAAPTTDTDSLPPTVTTDGMPQAAPELHAFAATQPKAVWRTQGSHHRELFKVLNERCARTAPSPAAKACPSFRPCILPSLRPFVPALPPLREGGQFLLEIQPTHTHQRLC